jgi:hypothetical protein
MAMAAALLGLGCGSVELEQPSLCRTQLVDVSPPAGGASSSILDLDFEGLPFQDQPGANLEVHLTALRAATPVGDFDGLTAVDCSIQPPAGSGLPERHLATWAPGPTPPGASLDLAVGDGGDLGSYLRAGKATLLVVWSGTLPATPSVTVTLCTSVKLTADLF